MPLPPPRDLRALPGALIAELTTHVPEPAAARACADLLGGAPPDESRDLLPYLAGRPGARYFDDRWAPYWPRVWGARGLLYVWDEPVAGVVLARLSDEAWRVAEMCLKVAARRDLPAAEGAVPLAAHELPRVRCAAVRVLGVCGDTEHVAVVLAAVDDPDLQVRRAAARALDLLTRRLDLPGPALA
jgi:HEAT repeat protein